MMPLDPCYWFFSFSTKQIATEQSTIAKFLFKPPHSDKFNHIKPTLDLILKSLVNSVSLQQFQSECTPILIDAFKNGNTNDFDDYLWISVIFFSMFMRCNFVGPFELTDYEIIAWDTWLKHKLMHNKGELTSLKCHEWLRVDHEDIEFELKYPFLLIVSTIILENGLSSNEHNLSWHWCYVRVLRYHQNILSHRSPTLQKQLLSHCKIIETLFPQSFNTLNDIKQQINNNETIDISLKQLLQCQFHIEYTLIANYYWKHDIVKHQMNSAKQCISVGFSYEMTSKLGKRTKWQTDSKPQLLLMVKSSIYRFFPSLDITHPNEEDEKQNKHKNTWFLPHNIPLEDDTILNEIKWDDDDDDDKHDDKLHYLERCILLFESAQSAVINKVKGISEISVLAYLDRLNINDNIHDWCIQTIVLLQRSRTEFTNYSKQTRAIQQFEAIKFHLDSIFNECRVIPTEYIPLKKHYNLIGVKISNNDNNKDKQSKKEKLNMEYDALCRDIAWKRLYGIYGTTLKSQSQILCELGDLYVGLGFHQSALAIYQQLKHYHKIATCLVDLDRKHDAKQMLLKQIEQVDAMNSGDNKVTICHHYTSDKKPYYLCLLGDITDDLSYYEEAWNVSHKTYARAMRTLSYHYYHKQQYSKCIECARSALRINSLFPKVWFLLGASAMHMKPEPIYEDVIEAFSFVVSIDGTDFEAWNNLGAAHLNLQNYKSALHALQEAGNLRRGNWKIWENILTCSLKLKKLSKSISTLSHLLDIKKDTMSVNPNVIAALTIELTHKIEKCQMRHEDNVIDHKDEGDDENDDEHIQTKTEEEKISKRTVVLLVKQFDALVVKLLNRLSEYSFISGTSHVNESPFMRTGLRNESMLHGVDDTKRGKQIQYAYDIYEIFSVYFEKSLRIEECIETRFKQSKIIMKYFERMCKNGQRDRMKQEYLKIVHVLSKLTHLYGVQMENKLEIKKLEQMLTSIQLLLNRAQRLSDKLYIDLKESEELMTNIDKMEQLTYKMKNEKDQKSKTPEKQESALSAFSDWM